MDSFRYILYVYKRTLLRTSGREKDKKTRCGSIRRSNGTTGGSKTHNHKYGIAVGSFYGHTLIAPNDAHPAVWSGLVSYDKDSGEATDSFHEWTKLEDRAVIGSGSMLGQTGQPYNARRYRYETDTKRESSLSPTLPCTSGEEPPRPFDAIHTQRRMVPSSSQNRNVRRWRLPGLRRMNRH